VFVEQLSSMYDEMAGPPGIPWAGLTADGHSLEENGYDPAYMDYMLKAGAEFFAAIGTLNADFLTQYKTLRDNDARASISRIMAVLEQSGADAWQALKAGNMDKVFALPRATTTGSLATIAASAANGAYLHYDGVMEAALRDGTIKPAEVAAHANAVTKVFQTFADLNKNGHLDALKQTPPTTSTPTSGFGVVPEILAAVGWEVAVFGVVLVAGLCYLVYIFWVALPTQKKVLDWCDKVAKTGTPEQTMACVNAAVSAEKNGNPGLGGVFGTFISPLVAVAAVAGALYVAPFIIKSFRGLRESKAT
jgi:hypothetical protein